MNNEIEIPEGHEAKIVGNKVVIEPKESNDERIRRELIEFLRCSLYVQDSGLEYEKIGEWVTWLEKQKEQKSRLKEANDLRTWLNIVSKVLTEFQGIGQYLDNPIYQEIANMLREKYCFDDKSLDWDRVYRKGLDNGEIHGYNRAKKEQKSAEWSEEDESYLQTVINEMEANKKEAREYEHKKYDTIILWLKSLRPRPKQEWSEEDDFMATTVENSFYLHCGQMTDRLSEQYKKFFEKVKSLRPQPHWKPSEEQMHALRRVTYKMGNSCFGKSEANDENLHNLYVTLKKL